MADQTHFRVSGLRLTACGINLSGPGAATSTEHKLAVTCEACKNTAHYGNAIQRIPTVLGGPYRG